MPSTKISQRVGQVPQGLQAGRTATYTYAKPEVPKSLDASDRSQKKQEHIFNEFPNSSRQQARRQVGAARPYPRRPRSVNASSNLFCSRCCIGGTRCRFCCTWSESAWPLALRPQSGQRGFPPIWSANSRADCIACACEQILVQWRTSSCKSRKPRVRICNCCHSKASRGTRVRAQPDRLARNSRLRRVVRPVRMPQAAHGMHACSQMRRS